MEFKNYKIEEFLNELGGETEAPGGGSTSALVLALAGGLNKMVYSFTIGKKAYLNLNDENKEKINKFNEKTKEFIEDSIKLMEEDKCSFEALMEGYRLPKDTENRGEIIQNLTFDAMNAPLKMAKIGVGFYENIKFATEYGNKGLITDAGVSAILLNGAIESAILNVRVNLKYFKDVEKKENILKEILEIEKVSNERKKEITKIVNKEIE